MGYRHVDNLGAAPRDHHRRYNDISTTWRGGAPAADPAWAGSRGAQAKRHVEPDRDDDVEDDDLKGMSIVYY
jgi:hypothetical protein